MCMTLLKAWRMFQTFSGFCSSLYQSGMYTTPAYIAITLLMFWISETFNKVRQGLLFKSNNWQLST